MPGQILCAVDRSEQAPPVARLGALLSEALGGGLRLVHVVEPVPGSQGIGGRLRRMMELEGREMLTELDAACGDRAAERMVRVGDPLNELLELSGEGSASLIVVGSRGRDPLKAALLGSTSARLATRSACPVVVVSPAASRRLQEDGERCARHRRVGLQSGLRRDRRGGEPVPAQAARASWVISSIPRRETNQVLLHSLDQHGYSGGVAVSAQSDRDAAILRDKGATIVLRPFSDAADQVLDRLGMEANPKPEEAD